MCKPVYYTVHKIFINKKKCFSAGISVLSHDYPREQIADKAGMFEQQHKDICKNRWFRVSVNCKTDNVPALKSHQQRRPGGHSLLFLVF